MRVTVTKICSSKTFSAKIKGDAKGIFYIEEVSESGNYKLRHSEAVFAKNEGDRINYSRSRRFRRAGTTICGRVSQSPTTSLSAWKYSPLIDLSGWN